MKTQLSRIQKDLETLTQFNSTPGSGVTRSAWSKEDQQAKDYLKNEMLKAGLEVWEDGIGTMFGKREGIDPSLPVVMVGSHYDTVVNGGAFDGQVGTIAALEVMRVLNENNVKNHYPIVMIAMNAEEGETYGPSTGVTNSRAIVGTLTYEELDRVKDRFGKTKRESMIEYGIEPNLAKCVWEKGSIKNFIEMHIEQGPVLEDENIEIGIVEYLPGIGRYEIIFNGDVGVSTMPLSKRKDALLAAAKFTVAVNDLIASFGEGITGGVAQMDISPNSNQFVPDYVKAKIEIRTFSVGALKGQNLTQLLQEKLKEVEDLTGVATKLIEMRRVGYSNPTPPSVMDDNNVTLIQEICDVNGFTHRILNDGTGHDAMIMTDFCSTNMVYVPSHKGITHDPEEWTDYEFVNKGSQVVLELTEKLARKN